jgi:hypothetical protein
MADYHMGTVVTDNMARESVEDANEIIEEIFAAEEWTAQLSS